MSHTPGPWSAYPPEMLDSKNWSVQTDSGMTIVCGDDTQETEANAHLISAAPDLLEACELLLIYLGDWDDMENETCAAARKAIAKAKGVV